MELNFRSDFGKWAEKQREKSGIKNGDLAQRMTALKKNNSSTYPSVITKIEKGKKKLTEDLVELWAKALKPNDFEFLDLALNKAGYPTKMISTVQEKMNFTMVAAFASLPETDSLGLVKPLDEVTENFIRTWQRCFEIKNLIVRDKNYMQAEINAKDLIGRDFFEIASGTKHSQIDPMTLAYLFDIMGNSKMHLGNTLNGKKYLNKAIKIGEDILQELSDNQRMPHIYKSWLIWLATTYDHRTDLYRTVNLLEDALEDCKHLEELNQKIKSDSLTIKIQRKKLLINLTRGAGAQQAVEVCDQIIENTPKKLTTNVKQEIAKVKAIKGWAYSILGEIKMAKESYNHALIYWEKIPKKENEYARKYERMKLERFNGDIHFHQGDYKSARRFYQDAQKTYALIISSPNNTTQQEPEAAMIYLGEGRCYLAQGYYDLAISKLEDAANIFSLAEHHIRLGFTKQTLATALAEQSNTITNEVLEHLDSAIILFEERNADGYAVSTSLLKARLLMKFGDRNQLSKVRDILNDVLAELDDPINKPEQAEYISPALSEPVIRNKYRARLYILMSINSALLENNPSALKYFELGVKTIRKLNTMFLEDDSIMLFVSIVNYFVTRDELKDRFIDFIESVQQTVSSSSPDPIKHKWRKRLAEIKLK